MGSKLRKGHAKTVAVPGALATVLKTGSPATGGIKRPKRKQSPKVDMKVVKVPFNANP